jgi:hypothetical protein
MVGNIVSSGSVILHLTGTHSDDGMQEMNKDIGIQLRVVAICSSNPK